MRQPNILLIMTDQWRHDFLGCVGADFLQTPNIDALALTGVCFTQATTGCPLCVPSRVALATGYHPMKSGIVTNDYHLPPQIPTFYARLRDHGYRVGCVGKLDLWKNDYR